ncbi:hypothetical protein DYB38_010757, partial [Aphanomyces astaci]
MLQRRYSITFLLALAGLALSTRWLLFASVAPGAWLHFSLDTGGCWELGHRDSFRDTMLNNQRTMATSDWGNRSVAFASHSAAYSADIAVEEMMVKLQQTYPDRRADLLKCLRIDLSWRMHK